jgi:hypothetical protein
MCWWGLFVRACRCGRECSRGNVPGAWAAAPLQCSKSTLVPANFRLLIRSVLSHVLPTATAGAGSDTAGVMCAFDRVATAPGVASRAPAAVSPLLTPPRYTYLMANDRGSALPFCDIVKLDACGTGQQVWTSDVETAL